MRPGVPISRGGGQFAPPGGREWGAKIRDSLLDQFEQPR